MIFERRPPVVELPEAVRKMEDEQAKQPETRETQFERRLNEAMFELEVRRAEQPLDVEAALRAEDHGLQEQAVRLYRVEEEAKTGFLFSGHNSIEKIKRALVERRREQLMKENARRVEAAHAAEIRLGEIDQAVETWHRSDEANGTEKAQVETLQRIVDETLGRPREISEDEVVAYRQNSI